MSTSPPSAVRPDPRRWKALAFVALAQLMVVLDGTVVNIALPSAQRALGFSDADRQWVVTAYALPFGALLLLGGRHRGPLGAQARLPRRRHRLRPGLGARRRGHRRRDAAGRPRPPGLLRRAAGPGGALPGDGDLHRAGRARQGLRRLGIDRRRRRGGRPDPGRVADRVLSAGAGRCWSTSSSPRSRRPAPWCSVSDPVRPRPGPPRRRRRGAGRRDWRAWSTASPGPSRTAGAPDHASACWSARPSLLILFVLVEAFSPAPLLPLRVVADRDRAGTYASPRLAIVGMFGTFLFLTYYLQAVRGMSPVVSGVAFLPMVGGMLIGASQIAARLMTRVRARALMPPGVPRGGGRHAVARPGSPSAPRTRPGRWPD